MKAASLRVASVYLTRGKACALRTSRRVKGAEAGCVVFISFVFVNGSVEFQVDTQEQGFLQALSRELDEWS